MAETVRIAKAKKPSTTVFILLKINFFFFSNLFSTCECARWQVRRTNDYFSTKVSHVYVSVFIGTFSQINTNLL